MYIAQKKRKENICEYLLYMWQVEDLIRATDCDEARINEMIVSRYGGDNASLTVLKKWYLELRDMMLNEGKRQKGHLDVHRIVLIQLEELHRRLLSNPEDYIYQALHYQILPAIIQLKGKGLESEFSDLEICFNAIYGYLTLRLKGEKILDETEKSVKQISSFLALLAQRYHQEQDKERVSQEGI